MNSTRIICIIGVDGTGKSTQVRLLEERLRAEGIICRPVWLRFSHIISLPTLLLARLIGLSRVERHEEHKIGFHEFWRKPWLARLYTKSLLLDTKLALWWKVNRTGRHEIIICDRFLYDTAIDHAIGCSVPEHRAKNIVHSPLLSLIPPNTTAVILDADDASVQNRRGDLQYDPNWGLRRDYYRLLSRRYNIPMIPASLPVGTVASRLVDAVWPALGSDVAPQPGGGE